MKVFILTTELTKKSGYSRYSIDLINALKKRGIEVIVAEDLPNPLSYKKRYFLALWYAIRLNRKAKDCDIIHCLTEPYSYITYILSRLIRKKYFITTHGTYGVLPYNLSTYKRYFHRKSFDNAEKVICVSNYTKKRMEEFGLNNLIVINNGINYDAIHQIHEGNIGNKGGFILSVGALKYRKGYHVSIVAFSKVHAKFKNLQYYIVGNQSDSSYFNYLKKMVSNLSLKSSVKFFTSISDSELIGLYKKAKMFLLTPVSEGSNFEGFGLVYLEAGACGLPVVGSLNSGAEDAINDKKTGLLVPQNDPEAVSEAILAILENERFAKKLGNNGIIFAKDHDWGNVVERYIEVYVGA